MAHRVAPRAELDLDDIWFYVAKESGSIEIANRLINSITERFVLLASFPYMGRSRDEDFGLGCRSFAVGEYVIAQQHYGGADHRRHRDKPHATPVKDVPHETG